MTNLFPFSTHSVAAIFVARSACDSIFGSQARQSLAVFYAYQILRCISREGRQCWYKDVLLSKQNNVKLDSCIKLPISIHRHTSSLIYMAREERIKSSQGVEENRNKLCCTNGGFAFAKIVRVQRANYMLDALQLQYLCLHLISVRF